jgi:hypothetical protein
MNKNRCYAMNTVSCRQCWGSGFANTGCRDLVQAEKFAPVLTSESIKLRSNNLNSNLSQYRAEKLAQETSFIFSASGTGISTVTVLQMLIFRPHPASS